jgi:hypothetical protein
MIVLIGRGIDVPQVLRFWRQEQTTAGEPQAGGGRNACHNLGIIGTPA